MVIGQSQQHCIMKFFRNGIRFIIAPIWCIGFKKCGILMTMAYKRTDRSDSMVSIPSFPLIFSHVTP